MTRILPLSVAIAALTMSFGAAQAEDLVFTLKNGTTSTMTRFYTSPKGVDDWEEDVFGQDVLEPGAKIEITIADGRAVCTYDMRFEFEESSDLDTTEDTTNLCDTGSYTITE